MRSLFLPILLLPLLTLAQASRVTTASQAQALETGLRAKPDQMAARSSLLEYYFAYGSANPVQAIPARRRHILWFVQNAPRHSALAGSAATIDLSGHPLADPQGYQQVAAAWKAQAEKPDVAMEALVHAALFFKLTDKTLTLQLLERAVAAEPGNKEFGARLGDQYALALMGVTHINRSGFPLATDPALVHSEAARHARAALEQTCQSPYALAKAGYQLGWQGVILRKTRKIAFDPAPLAKAALERAVKLAPGEAGVAAILAEFNRLPGQSVRAEMAAVAAPVVNVDVAKTVSMGMSRADVLQKLGQPSGKITSPGEDGKLVESLQYYGPGGKWAGTVRLIDGVVAKVDAPQ